MSKKITFISNIRQGEDTQQISFEAAVEMNEYQGFTTYEFKEPNMNVMNRIEVSETKANIFAGASTIELELDRTIAIQYQTPHGLLLLDSHMSHMDCSDLNNVRFQYSLSRSGDLIGNYEINLKIEG